MEFCTKSLCLPDTRRCASLLFAFIALTVLSLVAPAPCSGAAFTEADLDLSSGKKIYRSACIACHGAAGKGVPQKVRGFKQPSSFPDFSRCDQTTSELNNDYRAVITQGGPYRGFSQIMPSFKDALTPEQISLVTRYLRSFCQNPHWPPGELNLPLALNIEKAYPEDEVVVSSSVGTQGPGAVETHAIYEQRFGVKNQLEVDVPISFAQQNQTWYGGVGDTSIGVKHVMFSRLTSDAGFGSGTILSLQGNVVAPTGNSSHGLGSGTAAFETFVEAGQLFRSNTFIEFQGGAILPTDTSKAPQNTFWYTTVGQMLAQGHGLGRLWSPMVEILGSRDQTNQSKTDWDIVPQMQVTLSKRQHVRGAIGIRTPVNNTANRSPAVMFYVLWDWQEGSILKGW